MKSRLLSLAVTVVLVLSGTLAFADQLILKDGRQFSGKFIRADANVVEFRVFGKVETFKTAEVSQIVFKEPEMVSAPTAPAAPSAQRAPQAALPPAAPVADRQPAAQGASTATLPEGTGLVVRTTTTIDTDRNRVGDAFDAVLDEPLKLDDRVVVPRGAQLKGRIAYAKESGTFSGQSMLILELTELTVDGQTYPVKTSDYSQVGSERGKQTAGAVGGGAAVGAIIGAIAGGGKGAAVGAAAGAAVGTGVQVVTRGQTLKVPAETLLEFKLQQPLAIEAR